MDEPAPGSSQEERDRVYAEMVAKWEAREAVRRASEPPTGWEFRAAFALGTAILVDAIEALQ